MQAAEIKSILRHKSDTEQKRFRSYFQNLNVQHSLVSGEPSETYNAVAWSLGITNHWLWPGNTLADFDSLFTVYGYEKSLSGTIAVYGHRNANITHVAVQIDQNLWESKCGADLRIRHHLMELSGDCYGKPLAFYKPLHELAIQTNLTNLQTSLAASNANQLQFIKEKVAEVPKKLVLEFEKNFEDWRNTWFAGRLAINSNPDYRGHCIELFKLLKMDKAVIPLVVQKMTEKNNFFALQLFNRMYSVDDTESETAFTSICIESEQERVHKTISRYLSAVEKATG